MPDDYSTTAGPAPQQPDDTTIAVWTCQGNRCVVCNADPSLVRERGEQLAARLFHVHLLPICSGCDHHADTLCAMTARREALGARR